MSDKRPIKLVIPDTGPLVSLAFGDALDLLLLVTEDARIVLTDIVEYEATHRSDDLPNAQTIREFLQAHDARIEIMPTTIGTIALGDLKRRADAGESASLAKDLAELSIANFVMSLRTTNPGEPMLVLIEDDWFASNVYTLPGNIHLLSTSAWLDGLEDLAVIESASAVRSRIQNARPNFRADFRLDVEAPKIEPGIEWKSRFTPRLRR